MNKKGFISISVIYSFFLVFIAIIMSIILMYSSRRLMMLEIKKDVKSLIDSKSNFDCFSNGITKLNECIIYSYGGEDAITSTEDFSQVTLPGEYGLYSEPDNYGTSYYFRGDVPDNYVQFGQDYYGNDMYWRIVRINGDETIRLIYDGTGEENEVSEELSSPSEFNLVCDNPNDGCDNYITEYVNYIGSYAEQKLNQWYTRNLEDYSSDYIADGVFCNDRYNLAAGRDESFDYNPVYDSFNRLTPNNPEPSLECTNKSDRYTVEDIENGNGLLSKPIGLITADEIAMAGGRFGMENTSYYLYKENEFGTEEIKGMDFWTMTAYDNTALDELNGEADMWYVAANGSLIHSDGETNIENPHYLRPVINLKDDVVIKKGNGTISSPYVIKVVD